MIDPPGDGHQQKKAQEEARMDAMGGPTDSRTAAVNETKDATAPPSLQSEMENREMLRLAMSAVERICADHDEAYGYLSRLFVHCAPQCKALPDLPGLCTQIDNYIAGLHAKMAGGTPTGADSAGSGVPRTVNAEARGPESSSSSAPLLSAPESPNLSDEVLLRFWRSVQGPQDDLTGPLIRYAGLVVRAVAHPTGEALVRAVVTLLETLPPDYDWNADPHFLTLLEGAMSRLHSPTAKFKDAADPALRALKLQWLDLGDAAFREGWDRAAVVYRKCAADLDRLVPGGRGGGWQPIDQDMQAFYERRLREEWESVGGTTYAKFFYHPLLPGFTGDSRSAWRYLVKALQAALPAPLEDR